MSTADKSSYSAAGTLHPYHFSPLIHRCLTLTFTLTLTLLTVLSYSNDSGVTNLIHDRRSYVDFTLEVEANVARCVHSSISSQT